VAEVRFRQAVTCILGLVAALVVVASSELPAALAILIIAGTPLLGFLVIEARISHASDEWRERIFLELPVMAEQLGMLLGAGYSLGAALQRLARRGGGACGRDLRDVCRRTRHGVAETDALGEWAELADVPELSRLVQVLALNRQAGDLARLISEEARSARREVQRRSTEQIERRGQQVWIPVTVATLVPGVLFLAVPFIEAMRLFTGA
jgi:Flp pilus assembly protein TadB